MVVASTGFVPGAPGGPELLIILLIAVLLLLPVAAGAVILIVVLRRRSASGSGPGDARAPGPGQSASGPNDSPAAGSRAGEPVRPTEVGRLRDRVEDLERRVEALEATRADDAADEER